MEILSLHFYFNLDYTLARYKPSLHTLIYDHAKTFLVKNLRVWLIINLKTKFFFFLFEKISIEYHILFYLSFVSSFIRIIYIHTYIADPYTLMIFKTVEWRASKWVHVSQNAHWREAKFLWSGATSAQREGKRDQVGDMRPISHWLEKKEQ